MRVTALRAAWIAVASAVLGWGVHTYRAEQRVEVARGYARLAHRLPELRARLHEGVLVSRSAIVTHYDALTDTTLALEELHKRLGRAPDELDFDDKGRQTIANLATENSYTTQLVEDIKLHNAALYNSVRHMPIATRNLAEQLATLDRGDEVAVTLTELLGRALLVNLFPEERLVADVDTGRVVEVANEVIDDEVRMAALNRIVQHARVIVERKPKLDRMVSLLVTTPPEITNTVQLFDARYAAAVAAADDRYRILFLLIVTLIVAVAGDVILRSRRAAGALTRSNTQLEDALQQLQLEEEKTRELADMKSRFHSMTTHDLRTPLAVIVGSAEMLEAYGESWKLDKRIVHLDRIMANAMRMKRLVDAVLVVGSANAGMLQCNPRVVDLPSLCRRFIDMTRTADGDKHDLVLEIGEGVGDTILDPALLEHILLNLLSNACKFSGDGYQATLRVELHDDQAVFHVTDRGLGISEEDQRKLFEPFRRGTNVRSVPGTGIGLMAVKAALDAHNGTIEWDSEVGRGTRFTVHIPLGEEDEGGDT